MPVDASKGEQRAAAFRAINPNGSDPRRHGAMTVTQPAAGLRSGGTLGRYTAMAQALHWITAVLMLAAVVLAWVFMAMPDTADGRFGLITLHKSIGQTIFCLAIFRLIWRRLHPPPAMAGRLARWEARSAQLNYWLLYGIMLVMPLSGYILATAATRPSPYFWLFYVPQPPLVPAIAHAALRVHLICQFFVYAFISLHVMGAAWHVVVRRDATLDRMLPPQKPEQH